MARFIWEPRLLLLHIPRTGGTWMERQIEDLSIPCSLWTNKQHAWLPKKHSQLGQMYYSQLSKVTYTAAFVRHPADYYEAVWRWIWGVKPDRRGWIVDVWEWHPFNDPIKQWDPDFDVYIENMLNNCPAWATRTFEQYVGPEGGEYCDFIGRQETLAVDFVSLLGTMGYKDLMDQKGKAVVCSSRRNVGRMKEGTRDWNPVLRKAVERAEQIIIDRFYGYKTENKRWYQRLEREVAGEFPDIKGNPRTAYPRID